MTAAAYLSWQFFWVPPRATLKYPSIDSLMGPSRLWPDETVSVGTDLQIQDKDLVLAMGEFPDAKRTNSCDEKAQVLASRESENIRYCLFSVGFGSNPFVRLCVSGRA